MPRSIPSLYSMLFGAYAFSAHLFWRSRDVNTYLQHEMQIAVFYCFECCRLPLYKLQTKYYVESERESESKTATIYARPALHVVSSRSISNEPTAKTSCSNSFKLFYTYASVRRATPFSLKQTSGFFYTVWMCACLCEWVGKNWCIAFVYSAFRDRFSLQLPPLLRLHFALCVSALWPGLFAPRFFSYFRLSPG